MAKTDQKRLLRLLVLTGCFLLATGGAWAWYNVSPRQFATSYAFRAASHPVGYYFKAIPVGEEATQILATTNLINGDFIGPSAERVTAFMGTWNANDSKQAAVVGHTPDVCWVGAGWTPVALGHPEKLELDFKGTKIPFELRTFRPPVGNTLELTVWCTLISGQVVSESDRFELGEGAPQDRRERQEQGSRHLWRNNFFRMIRDRVPGTGAKQFVRFSTAIEGDWHPAMERLRMFGQRWLELQITRQETDGR
ncbi:MAG TPA: hypothetical protein VMB21_15430 [Candidatus Limnocylindria bacterium]|jgi:hypothetical protein|nr:hypothetical protein [Candidatus Limnocylindria bacterium]